MTTKTKVYRITAPYVTVKVPGSMMPTAKGRTGAETVLGFYRGALLPPGVAQGEVDRLAKTGMLEEVEVDG